MADGKVTDNSRSEMYLKQFDPARYINEFFIDFEIEDSERFPYIFRQEIVLAHDIFKEGYLKGETMLDFASGPSIVFSIIPSLYYKEVYYSDLVKANRDFIKDWWHNKGDTHDFKACFDLAASVKGKSTPWEEGPALLRSKIKGVFACDIHDQNVLEETAQPKQFDLVTNSLMLNVAPSSDEDAAIIIQRLAGLVKPGGHLIIFTTFDKGSGIEYYKVGDLKFPLTRVRSETVKAEMNKNGLHLLYWYELGTPIEELKRLDGKPLLDCTVYAVACKK